MVSFVSSKGASAIQQILKEIRSVLKQEASGVSDPQEPKRVQPITPGSEFEESNGGLNAISGQANFR